MEIDFVRNMLPAGCRVQLIDMASDPNPVEPGTMGTVNFVDDIGTVFIDWDNGRCLGLVIGVDRFLRIK